MNMKHLVALLGAAFCLGGPALAQAQAGLPAESVAAVVSLTDGEIKRVDGEAGKLTIKHGPIKNLDMPSMTMVFVVKDLAALPGLKAGDKIRFVATNESGKYFASDIQAAK